MSTFCRLSWTFSASALQPLQVTDLAVRDHSYNFVTVAVEAFFNVAIWICFPITRRSVGCFKLVHNLLSPQQQVHEEIPMASIKTLRRHLQSTRKPAQVMLLSSFRHTRTGAITQLRCVYVGCFLRYFYRLSSCDSWLLSCGVSSEHKGSQLFSYHSGPSWLSPSLFPPWSSWPSFMPFVGSRKYPSQMFLALKRNRSC